jgi:hypothetical protein
MLIVATEGSLTRSQGPDTYPRLETDEQTAHSPIKHLFL